MLTFEFVQTGEFDDPWYEVYDKEYIYGGIYYTDKGWLWSDNDECYLDASILMEIAIKLDELNGVK